MNAFSKVIGKQKKPRKAAKKRELKSKMQEFMMGQQRVVQEI